MRKLLSRAVHFTLHADQCVTCADCVSPDGRSVRPIFPVQGKTETKLILKVHYKQLGWAADGGAVSSGGPDIKVFTVEGVLD